MKGQKQSRTEQLEKKLQASINVITALVDEVQYLKTLSIGTLETIKQMDCYDDAIAKLVEEQKQVKDVE
jgi:FtsZ-binding cell division protein ZapB